MKIIVTGGGGFVGSALIPFLMHEGHEVTRLVRSQNPTTHSGITWDPPRRGPDPDALAGFEAVVHLAGEPITSRWTESTKQAIRESRGKSTLLLANSLARMSTPPKVLVSASAIGIYGNRGQEVLRENSALGTGFLPDVCKEWEATTKPAADKGIRVVNLRIGVVLSPMGGALGKMLLPFKMGLGGKIGSGAQCMSWIALDDVLSVILFSLTNESLRGPVNTVAPRPVTNAEYTRILGKVLGRPTFIPMPAALAKLAFGELADAVLLASARVEPAALANKAYKFRYVDLEGALRHLLGK